MTLGSSDEVAATTAATVLAAPALSAGDRRNQGEARRAAVAAYPYRCCVLCGLQICLQIAHLDQNAGHNEPDNLAYFCPTHHGMFDSGLYPVVAIKLLREHWQVTKGKLDHSARMKDAGKKAGATRTRNLKAARRNAGALKAVATRRANLAARGEPHSS